MATSGHLKVKKNEWISDLCSIVVVQLLSRGWLFATLWAPLSSTVSWSLLKLMSIELVVLSSHPILGRPHLLLPSIFPSISLCQWVGLHIRWPKYWSFSNSSSNEYSGLISFRIDWFDLAIQVTLKSLLQHHSWKTSILQCSAFFMVQLSHPYMTTRKSIALTRQTFVCKVMSLLDT